MTFISSVQFSSVQSLSRVQLFATPWIAAHQASLSITNSRSLPKLMSIEAMMPSSHLIFCRPLLLLPPIPPNIRVFSNESTLRMRWPKYWSFRFSISPSNEHPGLISFRMYWLDLLAVQGTLKSLLQHHGNWFKGFKEDVTFFVWIEIQGVGVNSRSWWWTGRPGVLQFMGSQRVSHDWVTKLNWTDCWAVSHA